MAAEVCLPDPTGLSWLCMATPRALILTVLCLFSSALAQGGGDTVQFLENLVVEQDVTLGDAVCIFCSVDVRGDLQGDAVAVFGSVEVSGSVGGDVVSVGGGIELDSSAEISGDCVAAGGRVEADPGARVGGDSVSTIPIAWFFIGGLLFLLFLVGLMAAALIGLVLLLRRHAGTRDPAV